MTKGTHNLVSLSVTLQTSPGPSERITMVDCTLKHTCRCGVMSEYNWTSVPVSSERMEELASGLIVAASLAVGRPEHRTHSQVSSLDLPMS